MCFAVFFIFTHCVCAHAALRLLRAPSLTLQAVELVDERVRDCASFDFAAECRAWLSTDSFKHCYTRLVAEAADNPDIVARLGLSSVHELYQYSRSTGTYDLFTVVQTRRAVLLDLLPSPDAEARKREIELTDLELRVFEVIADAHVVLLYAVEEQANDETTDCRYELQFRDLHDATELPRVRNTLFIGHVDNGTHAVAVVPSDSPFRWLRPRDGIVRELGSDVCAHRDAAADRTRPSSKKARLESSVGGEATPTSRAPSGVIGLLDGDVKDGKTASTSQSQGTSGSTTSKTSFGPEALHVKVPVVAGDRLHLRTAISATNVRSRVDFRVIQSRPTYMQFKCESATCPAFLTYFASSNGLILNEKKSNLDHTCRADSAQEVAKAAESEKKWTRSKLTLKQLLQLARTHNTDVMQHGKAKSFLNAILRSANLGDAKVGSTLMYDLFKAAKEQVRGVLLRISFSLTLIRTLGVWLAGGTSQCAQGSVCQTDRDLRRRPVHQVGDAACRRQRGASGVFDCHAVRARSL